jgi:hypothetical protein
LNHSKAMLWLRVHGPSCGAPCIGLPVLHL